MSNRVYCTYFDSAYVPRGRVLVEGLRRHGDTALVYVLALDDVAYQEASRWGDLNVTAITLAELEACFPELAAARESRSRMEYVFTLTPVLTQWVSDQMPEDGWITYLDADMGFFSSTDPIYDELANGSVGIVEHRFTWEQSWRRKYGRFNVAWVSFRKDPDGMACLAWWRDSCLEWCYDEVVSGRFADQGYLDEFPSRFSGVVVVRHPGVDVAPWNLRRHRITAGKDGSPLVDGVPLIFFHFHGLRREGRRYFFKHVPYLARTTVTVRDLIYRPYCQALSTAGDAQVLASVAMTRRPTLLASLRSGRAATLQWLGVHRGDYVDVSNS